MLTRFSQSADRLQLQTQHKDKYNTNTKKNCKHRENPKHKKRQTQKRIQIQKIPTKDKYKIKHKHEKNLNAKMKRNTTRLAASAMLLCTGWTCRAWTAATTLCQVSMSICYMINQIFKFISDVPGCILCKNNFFQCARLHWLYKQCISIDLYCAMSHFL